MFEQLWEESPMVQEMKKQYLEQGEIKEKIEGEVKTLQRLLMREIEKRFPQLTELAQMKVKQLNECDALDALYQQVQDATDVQAVQQLLVVISEEQV